MDQLFGTLTVVGMFLLRLAVPIALMVGVVAFFRRMDVRWQTKAWAQWKASLEQEESAAGARWLARLARPCCDEKGCDPADVARCPAGKHKSLPCWMARRMEEGSLPKPCYHCERFTMKPATVPAS